MNEDPRRLTVMMHDGRALVPCQDAMLTAKPTAWIRGLFGGLGSGKTNGGALAMLAHAAGNPWSQAYGGGRPQSLVIGTTWSVLKDSAFAAFFTVVPPQIIRRHRKADRVTELVNGHEILWRTTKGKIEGNSVTGLWLDEAHLLDGGSGSQWLNYQARVRDMRARSRIIIVTGIPVHGWCQDVFDDHKSASDPERLTLHARTADNPYLPPNYLEQLRKSVSKKEALAYFEGAWMPTTGAALYEFDPTKHIVDDIGDRSKPTHVSMDIGNRGAVLFIQEVTRNVRDVHGKVTKDRGLHVVDEILPENVSVRTAAREIASRGWMISSEHSLLFMDPNADRDEIEALRDVFGPKISIVRKQRADNAYYIEYGLRCVNAALCDADGNVRLTISRALPRHERSLLTALPRYRVDDVRRTAIKDNRTDHVVDALRMCVAHVLPTKAAGLHVRAL